MQPFDYPEDPNLQTGPSSTDLPVDGETISHEPVVQSTVLTDNTLNSLPMFDPVNIIDMTFLCDCEVDDSV